MIFRREYKLIGSKFLRLQIIGRRLDNQTPYLRVADRDNKYLGSLEGATLYHLRNAISKAIEK